MISFERNVCNIRSSQKSINFHHNKYFSQTCSLFRKWPFHIVGETLFSLKYKKAPIVSSLEKKTNTHVESIYNYYASLLVFVVWPRGQQLTVNPFAQKREKCSKQPFQCQASELEECMYIEINSTYFTTVQIDTLGPDHL